MVVGTLTYTMSESESSSESSIAFEDMFRAPEHYDEPVERFIFEVSSGPDADEIDLDEDACERLRNVLRKTVEKAGAELVDMEIREQSVFVGMINTSNTPLATLLSGIQKRSQRQYERTLDREQRHGQSLRGTEAVKWGGLVYIGPGDEDYRADPPAIPEDLDRTPESEIRRLAMAYGVRLSPYLDETKDELRERRPEPASTVDRVRSALGGES